MKREKNITKNIWMPGKEYQNDVENCNTGRPTFSVDSQKVIMLPRCDMFKEIIFTPGIIAFNEYFVPVGKKH